uniref:NADH dehydrogenase subunit 6 n=1 Tax=Berthellina sp. TLT-2006 TaxID=407122 RepID=E6Y132_9GAST|nr:NADH dehydrogenase subunit 6 [Berthellina sp. TLT-2006]ABK92218.1 NADH dehydrogenase subunit 6 [Berthellina sp. TLT-2006]
MNFFYLLSVFLLFCFPLFKNPLSMMGILVCMSLSFVGFISILSSSWFSYVLFLVYVGGLLVLFMYICLINSNYSFNLSASWVLFFGIMSLYLSIDSESHDNFRFLGGGNFNGGEELVELSNLSIFLFLGVVLLVMLLVVVRASGAGSIVVNNEKS